MADQQQPISQPLPKRVHSNSGKHTRLFKRKIISVPFIAATAIGVLVIGLSKISLIGTIIVLVLVTLMLCLVSPIIVPAGILQFLIASGFLFTGNRAVAAMEDLAWLYENSERSTRARYLKEKAKEHGQSLKDQFHAK